MNSIWINRFQRKSCIYFGLGLAFRSALGHLQFIFVLDLVRPRPASLEFLSFVLLNHYCWQVLLSFGGSKSLYELYLDSVGTWGTWWNISVLVNSIFSCHANFHNLHEATNAKSGFRNIWYVGSLTYQPALSSWTLSVVILTRNILIIHQRW